MLWSAKIWKWTFITEYCLITTYVTSFKLTPLNHYIVQFNQDKLDGKHQSAASIHSVASLLSTGATELVDPTLYTVLL